MRRGYMFTVPLTMVDFLARSPPLDFDLHESFHPRDAVLPGSDAQGTG